MANLISTADTAQLLGVARQRVHQLRHERDDFPTPVIERTRATFYAAPDVTRWASRHQYPKGGARS